MDLAELLEIAERERRTQKPIRVRCCVAAGCLSSNGLEVKQRLEAAVADAGLSDQVEVCGVGCLRLCSRGPLVQCDPQGTLFEHVLPEHAPSIVAALSGGAATARCVDTAQPFFSRQLPIVLENSGRIDPERIEAYIAAGGYQALAHALRELSPAAIVETITASGLRGRGGAGYTTGLKWATVAKMMGERKFVVCNADEGDPGAFMDRSVLESDPHRVLEGMAIAAYAVGASQGYVYVRGEYPLAIRRLQIAIQQAKKLGLLGSQICESPFDFKVDIRIGAGAFVCGEETALMASIEGQRGTPRPRPPYPAEQGLWGCPTLINNVETFANIAPILRNGAEWFAGIGTEKSKGTKVFALAGNIRNTGLIEVPMGITARICGICPVSHLLASAKAGDQILAVTIPSAAEKLRRLMNLAQIVQSHALSFFHLSAPDLLLGMNSEPAARNVFGLIAAEPDVARGGIRLRQFGQEIIELLGGRKIHPTWAVPGGVREGLAEQGRAHIHERLPEARASALDALGRFKRLLDQYDEESRVFGNFPSLFMGLVAGDGGWEHYDGHLGCVDGAGSIVADGLDPTRYADYIGEAIEPWSYLKFPYYRPLGYPAGMYRVGPLARLNICTRIGTPLADQELREFRERGGGTVNASFYYHYARLIEILAAIERIEQLIDDSDLSSTRLRASAGINQLEGVGVSEAPRGTLFHHYQVDEHGLITKVNLIIATGQNNLAMNLTVAQIARHYIHGPQIPEGMLNRIEAGIRAFDPCLSCSTHAVGAMPLQVTLIGSGGEILDEVTR